MKTWCAAVTLLLAACASQPPSSGPAFDEQLRKDVSSQLQASREVNGWNIQVEAFKGNVTLTGAVTSPRQKQEAERLAASVPGVRVVFNQIVIKE